MPLAFKMADEAPQSNEPAIYRSQQYIPNNVTLTEETTETVCILWPVPAFDWAPVMSSLHDKVWTNNYIQGGGLSYKENEAAYQKFWKEPLTSTMILFCGSGSKCFSSLRDGLLEKWWGEGLVTLVPEPFFYIIFFISKFATRSANRSAQPRAFFSRLSALRANKKN